MKIPAHYLTMNAEEYDRTRTALVALAVARHAQYPQYDGHWDDWVLVVVAKNVELKGGRGLEFWQVSIGTLEPADQYSPEPTWSVYSPQRNSNVGRLSTEVVSEVSRA
jgi:hypothetical protein